MEEHQENPTSWRKGFKEDLHEVSEAEVLSKTYVRKKLLFWFIRAVLSVILYIIFWKYEWVRWSLFLTVPVSLISLLLIVLGPYLLRRKIRKLEKRIDQL